MLYTKDGYIDTADSNMPSPTDPRGRRRATPAVGRSMKRRVSALHEADLHPRRRWLSLHSCDAPPRACWDAWWISDRRKDSSTGCGFMVGLDHRSLIVKCPDGHSGWSAAALQIARCRTTTPTTAGCVTAGRKMALCTSTRTAKPVRPVLARSRRRSGTASCTTAISPDALRKLCPHKKAARADRLLGFGVLTLLIWALDAAVKWAVGWLPKMKFGGP
jgi:hypothetical protein